MPAEPANFAAHGSGYAEFAAADSRRVIYMTSNLGGNLLKRL